MEPSSKGLEKPLAIVGYMGSGKTTVGRIASRMLGWRFVGLDRKVSQSAGCTIPEIFERCGESYFRDLEEQALTASLERDRTVISCGGGVISRRANRDRLKEVSTVFLEERLDVLYRRTRGKNRPLRAVSLEDFERRYHERLPHYLEVSDLRLQVGQRDSYRVAEEVVAWLSGSK